MEVLGSRFTIAAGLVFLGVAVMLVGFSLRPDQPSQDVGRQSSAPVSVETSSPTPTTETPTPSLTPTPTPTPEPVVRLCWGGARITGSATCASPFGAKGLATVSPLFAVAKQDGRCRPIPKPIGLGGYLCRARGAEVRFAVFGSTTGLNAYAKRTYRSCRTDQYVRVCTGPDRVSLRYVDQRFRIEVSTRPAGRAVLRSISLRPPGKLLRGTVVS
jgi:hypothetical protein